MASSYFYIFIFLLYSNLSYNLAQQQHSRCPTFTCGSRDSQIRFPFINTTINSACGSFILNCSSYPLPEIQLNNQGRWYPVEIIDYFQKVLVIQDPVLQNQLESNLCNSLSNFTDKIVNPSSFKFYLTSTSFAFFKCKRDKLNDSHQKVFFQSLHNYTGCVDDYDLFFTGDNRIKLPNLPGSLSNFCSTVQLPVPLWWNTSKPVSWLNPVKVAPWWNLSEPIRNLTSVWGAKYSFSWDIFLACFQCLNNTGGFCLEDPDGGFLCGSSSDYAARRGRRRKTIIGLSLSVSVIMLIMIISYYYSRKRYLTTNSVMFWKRTKNAQLFKDFLQYHKSLTPQRYSYSDIKKMTNSFKNKLGQGGYGGVFKGKLPDGRFVAVKVLKESKGNGEDFINEVASISKTSHVNIVRLVGFCSEGPERALVYDFMPNGSLDKFIYNKSSNTTSCSALDLEMLYEIAIGIAHGLEYLHRDCSARIVHFDIKPHNILLDENFSPKISDFGLAKLSARKDSAMSVLGARGTIGYIAPEVVYAHYGGVSYKSDVYSYGMMVLEMVGRRHNVEEGADRTSEMYFPDWLCQHLEQEEDLRLHGIESESEREIAKKMILVGLWCIQTNPSDRPSISKALEMLEGSLESIETPPQPCLYSPPQRSIEDSSAD